MLLLAAATNNIFAKEGEAREVADIDAVSVIGELSKQTRMFTADMVEGRSVILEKYARQMICAEEIAGYLS
jgi:hypothetical protein